MSSESKSLVPAGHDELVVVATRANSLVTRGLNEARIYTPVDASFYLQRGIKCFNNGDYDNAIKDFIEVIQLDSSLADAFHFRGKIWKMWGMFGKAMQDYDEAIRLDSSKSVYFYHRAVCNRRAISSIADLNEAIRIDPEFKDAYIERGVYWSGAGYCAPWTNPMKGIEDFDKVIMLDPNDADCYRLRAYCWEMTENYAAAIKDFNDAIRLDRKNALHFAKRGTTWFIIREYDKAISDYDEACRLAVIDEHARMPLGDWLSDWAASLAKVCLFETAIRYQSSALEFQKNPGRWPEFRRRYEEGKLENYKMGKL